MVDIHRVLEKHCLSDCALTNVRRPHVYRHKDIADHKLSNDRLKSSLEDEKREHLRNVVKLQQEITKFRAHAEESAKVPKQTLLFSYG